MIKKGKNIFYAWIHAARLRTLPLSVSGILVGGALAFENELFSWSVFVLLLSTTLLLQILSNFANDYGDFLHGTDNDQRVGPIRAVQSGQITSAEMKNGIILVSLLALFSGLTLLYLSLGYQNIKLFILFTSIGLLAILAALKYTIGNNPFGYKGMGDLMVFIFFGLVAVIGSYFLLVGQICKEIWLPAATIGFLSTGVLNINNMRDVENDRISGKSTLIARMGSKNGKFYHTFLIVAAILCLVVYLIIIHVWVGFLWILIPVFLLFLHIVRVIKITKPDELDPELKRLSIITLLMSVLFGAALITG
jgi:1,4-dihydroxy-2-naphthoate polyprenyltransferase